jgi:hypothetical protein
VGIENDGIASTAETIGRCPFSFAAVGGKRELTPRFPSFHQGPRRKESQRKPHEESQTGAMARIEDHILTREQLKLWRERTRERLSGKILFQPLGPPH